MKKGFIKQDFYNMLKTNHTTGCMEWQGCKDNLNYGMTWLPEIKRIVRTHRLSLYLEDKLDIKDSETLVCHHCDNPSCCNPDHLFVGTTQDNSNDKVAKNRHFRPIGVLNTAAKLSEDDVIHIRKLLNQKNARVVKIAEMFNVSRYTIYDIQNSRTWGHIE